jgi:hypothetical protein
MVLLATWTVVALLIGGYIWFVVWRMRMEKRKKEVGTSRAKRPAEPLQTGLAARLKEQGALQPLEPYEPTPSPFPSPGQAATPSTPSPSSPSSPSMFGVAPTPPPVTAGPSVAELLSGIRLPEDLVPITMMEPRGDIVERVAFASDPGADPKRVGTAFADELQRLGYTVAASGEDQLAATRGTDHLLCQLHVDARYAEIAGKRAFPAVPDNAVVIEVWIPF